MSTPDTFATLPLHALISSLTNPRKTFNPDKLQELANSIKASGVHQPILVRPLPGSRVQETSKANHRGQKHQGYIPPTHEIVAGERRYRASQLAGVATIPAMVRDLTDDQVLEIQLVENLQRTDLSELEEAEGYELLMQHTSINADAVGDKIGKSRSYVYARLKLLDLSQDSKQALRDGQIDASRALLIARIPDGKLQIKALSYAIEAHAGEVPSLRELQVWLRQNVMLQLDRAPFQITSANLVPLAGSCKTCPKRTGANPDIFSDVDGADICTDPPCYNLKCEAHLAELHHQADKRGMRLVYGPEAKAICYDKSSALNGYSPLSQVRNDLSGTASGKRLDHLLSPSPTVPIAGAVLIENPFTRELIAAIPTAEAEAALLAKGLLKAMPDAKGIKKDVKIDKETYNQNVKLLELRMQTRITDACADAQRAAIVKAVMATSDDHAQQLLSVDMLREYVANQASYYFGQNALEGSGLDYDGVDNYTVTQVYKASALIFSYKEEKVEATLAEDKQVDFEAIRNEVTAKIKADVAAEIAALKKTPAPTTPLAQPSALPVANAQSKPAPRGKAKLSAADAQSGIADALQGIEAPPTDGAVPVLKSPVKATKKSQPAPPVNGALALGFAVGQQVKVTLDTDKLGMIAAKYAGKQGSITKREPGGGYWDVTFKGRNGGVAMFTEDQIEAIA